MLTAFSKNFKMILMGHSWSLCRLFLKMGHPGLFFVFRLFKQTIQFLQQINVKNIHPVYRAGIQTQDLRNMSLLPPLTTRTGFLS